MIIEREVITRWVGFASQMLRCCGLQIISLFQLITFVPFKIGVFAGRHCFQFVEMPIPALSLKLKTALRGLLIPELAFQPDCCGWNSVPNISLTDTIYSFCVSVSIISGIEKVHLLKMPLYRWVS